MLRILVILFFLPLLSHSQQRVNLVLFGGTSNYTGDLQEKRFTTDQAGPTFGAGINYRITPRFYVRAGLQYGQIGADDKKSTKPLNVARNLNFKSSLFEGSLIADYSFFDLTEKRFTPYIFAGLALFHFNPYTHDTAGTKFYLHKLTTEGEGLASYPDRKKYNLVGLAIPFGGGLRFRINESTVLGYEIGLRKTSTDYLDDVSGMYASAADLLAAHGPKAVELSYRGGELKNGSPAYPTNGQRGGAKFKDWYYFQGLTLSIGLFDHDGPLFKKSPYGRVDCPRPVL